MSFLKKNINIYIILINVIKIISSNIKSRKLEYCNIDKYCNDCKFCGEGTNDYTPCSYYNLFCTKNLKNYTIFEETYLNSYSTFFRNIPNANDFCGQATYTLGSLTDSFLIISKSDRNVKKANIKHCNYEIYNTKYFYNNVDSATLTIKLKTNNFEKSSMKLMSNILIQNSRLRSAKQIVFNEVDLSKNHYELSLYNYDTIIILLDFYVERENNEDTDEYLEIRVDTNNSSIRKKNKKILILLTVIFSFIGLSIILAVIIGYRYFKRIRYMSRIQKENLQEEKLKRKQKEGKINKLFETILKPVKFNENRFANVFTECPICIEKFLDECLICVTPCKHIFHYECLNKFVNKSKEKQRLFIKCPLCNFDFLDEKNNDDKLNEINNNNNEVNKNSINKNENNERQNNSMNMRRIVDGNFIRCDTTSKDDLKNNNVQTEPSNNI